MPSILRSKASVDDLREIWLHIAKDSAAAADRFVRQLDERIEALLVFPSIGRSRPALAPGVFSFPFDHVVVFYTQDLEGLKIVRILQGARDVRPELFGHE